LIEVIMLAVLNHRASAYHELHAARTKLMGLRQTRSGLFVAHAGRAHTSPNLITLLAEIASAKFEELRVMLCLDILEKKLHEDKAHRAATRIWLGSIDIKPGIEPPQPRTQPSMNSAAAYLLTRMMLRHMAPKLKL
jgi:hypothetical protein